MSGINPISGQVPAIQLGGAGQHGGKAGPLAGKFSQAIGEYVNNVDADQQASTAAIEDLLSGRSQDPLPVVAAMAKADLSFKLLMGVRNKVIEAYKQTINMQI